MKQIILVVCMTAMFLTAAAAQSPAKMRMLGRDAALGSNIAIDQIEQILTEVESDNAKRKQQKSIPDLAAAALETLTEKAGEGSSVALDALTYANSKRLLRSYVPSAIGKAATMGNNEAVQLLVNYNENGWLLSSVVFALEGAALRNEPAAVELLLKAMDDPGAKALWAAASKGLAGAAAQGNVRAKEALIKYNQAK